MQATNHPQPGSLITVDPLRSLDHVRTVRDTLSPRDRVLFSLGVNVNLRAGDLLDLRVGNIDFENSRLVLREKKTGKRRTADLSPEMQDMLIDHLGAGRALAADSLVFTSRKGGGRLTVASLNHMVKKWCKEVGLRGNFGSHSLRKTWAYLQYRVFGVDLAVISKALNHSSMAVTYRYIGINDAETQAMYRNFI